MDFHRERHPQEAGTQIDPNSIWKSKSPITRSFSKSPPKRSLISLMDESHKKNTLHNLCLDNPRQTQMQRWVYRQPCQDSPPTPNLSSSLRTSGVSLLRLSPPKHFAPASVPFSPWNQFSSHLLSSVVSATDTLNHLNLGIQCWKLVIPSKQWKHVGWLDDFPTCWVS